MSDLTSEARLQLLHLLAQEMEPDGKRLALASEQALIKALDNDNSQVVRHEAAFLLGDCQSRGVLNDSQNVFLELRAATKQKSILVRHEVALALGKFRGSNEAVQCLLFLYRDSALEVSESAEHALVELFQTVKPTPPMLNRSLDADGFIIP